MMSVMSSRWQVAGCRLKVLLDRRPVGRMSVIPQLPAMALLIALAVAVLGAAPAAAEIAVFVDGRIIKVDDAYLDGEEIVLELTGGGRLAVSAVRIDRVVADEVEAPETTSAFDVSCPSDWAEEPLPEGLPFRSMIESAARAADLHPWLLAALVEAESAFDPNAVSRVGASGLTQLMPAAAADTGVDDVFDPQDNLRGGASHLRTMLNRFESLPLALAAYNAGAATVERYDGIPPYRETRGYVRRVLESFCP
jgi:soluble lytic murein transglycosylase-like protein